MLRELLHYAWDTSSTWPNFITDPQKDKLYPNWATGDTPEDGPALVPHLKGATREKWCKYTLQKDPAEPVWTEADFLKAQEKSNCRNATRQDGHAPSIEIAFELGKDGVAIELVRKYLIAEGLMSDQPSRFISWSTVNQWQVLRSPRLWKLLSDGWLRRELGVTTQQVETFVDESVAWLDQRLRNGPSRPYRDHTVKELCHLFNDKCIKSKRLGGGQGATMSWEDDPDNMPDTFLAEPATDDEIQELEQKAKAEGYTEGLPGDYKEFLKVTNGFSIPGEPDSPQSILYPTEVLQFDGDIGDEVELLHPDSLNCDVKFEWPPAREFLNVGAGGDEGSINLLDPESTNQAIEAFKKTYEAAGAVDRKRIERAVKDTYGSVDELLNLKYPVLRWYHWFPALEGCYASFRHLLEIVVMEAMTMPDIEESEGAEEESDPDEDELNESDDDEQFEEDSPDEDEDEEPATKKQRI